MIISEAAKATEARASLRAATLDLSGKIRQSGEMLRSVSGKDVAAAPQTLGEDDKAIVACCQEAAALRQDFDEDTALVERLEAELVAARERARKKRLIIIGAIAVFVVFIILAT